MTAVYAFEVWAKGWNDHSPAVVNARSRGTAKYGCWLSWHDTDERLKITDMRARKVGAPVTTEQHERTMKMRVRPDLRAGVRVVAEGDPGVVVGTNSSGNFDVLLDGHKHPVNVHPMGITPEAESSGSPTLDKLVNEARADLAAVEASHAKVESWT